MRSLSKEHLHASNMLGMESAVPAVYSRYFGENIYFVHYALNHGSAHLSAKDIASIDTRLKMAD